MRHNCIKSESKARMLFKVRHKRHYTRHGLANILVQDLLSIVRDVTAPITVGDDINHKNKGRISEPPLCKSTNVLSKTNKLCSFVLITQNQLKMLVIMEAFS